MNVLLDEDVKERMRHHFGADTIVETVGYRGFRGLQSGALLAAAEESFDALVTLDSNLPHQRNLSEYDIGVVVVRPRDQTMNALTDLVPEISKALRDVRPGEAIVVTDPIWEDRPAARRISYMIVPTLM